MLTMFVFLYSISVGTLAVVEITDHQHNGNFRRIPCRIVSCSKIPLDACRSGPDGKKRHRKWVRFLLVSLLFVFMNVSQLVLNYTVCLANGDEHTVMPSMLYERR